MPGRLGLKDGAIPEYPGVGILGMGINGEADCGPCGIGRRASREVESSIYTLERAFATRILHAVPEAFSIGFYNSFCRILDGYGKREDGLIFPVKQDHRDS